jgi:hypothetical protein
MLLLNEAIEYIGDVQTGAHTHMKDSEGAHTDTQCVNTCIESLYYRYIQIHIVYLFMTLYV